MTIVFDTSIIGVLFARHTLCLSVAEMSSAGVTVRGAALTGGGA